MVENTRILVVSVVCVTLLAGCIGQGLFPPPPEYHIYGNVVANPPANATVLSPNDPRIRDIRPLQTVIRNTSPEDGAAIQLNKTQYQHLKQIFTTVSTDTTDSKQYPFPAIYVQTDAGVVRISIDKIRPG